MFDNLLGIAALEDNIIKAEERARSLGWVPKGNLTTVEDATTVGPGAYDTRVLVALSPGAHRVRFRYEPRWPLNGLAILAFTVAVGEVFALGRRSNYDFVPVS